MIPLKDDNPTTTLPVVTVAIIVLNVFIFFYPLWLRPNGRTVLLYKAAVIPYEITHFTQTRPGGFTPLLTIISSMFLHDGIFHLGGNMLFLWIFGDNIEDRFGHVKFILFYLFTGTVATLVHIALNASSTTPLIGASGAIAGVLGAYFLLFPRAHVLTLVIIFFFIRIVKLPAIFFLGFWFVFQLLSSASGGGGQVAWFAHVGGFLCGALIVLLLTDNGIKKLFH